MVPICIDCKMANEKEGAVQLSIVSVLKPENCGAIVKL